MRWELAGSMSTNDISMRCSNLLRVSKSILALMTSVRRSNTNSSLKSGSVDAGTWALQYRCPQKLRYICREIALGGSMKSKNPLPL